MRSPITCHAAAPGCRALRGLALFGAMSVGPEGAPAPPPHRAVEPPAAGPPPAEQAAHTWPTDHFDTAGHEYFDRITLSRAPARTTTIRRISKTPRSAVRV
ncbi:hypothetical protein ACFU8W_24255 [Streptomyces sp. NPDC057565]|uniref:hypothetical protein n=1 Tax=Streptomyces sp. NPDC057565 TaxID=3346169 RepID=UPI00367822D8